MFSPFHKVIERQLATSFFDRVVQLFPARFDHFFKKLACRAAIGGFVRCHNLQNIGQQDVAARTAKAIAPTRATDAFQQSGA